MKVDNLIKKKKKKKKKLKEYSRGVSEYFNAYFEKLLQK